MLTSDYEYVEGMNLLLEELNAEVDSTTRAIAFIYERGESSPGEISMHLSDLDLLRTQAWFAEVAATLLGAGTLPERKVEPTRRSGDITDLMIERARAYPIEKLVEVGRGMRINCISPDHDDTRPSMDIRNNYAYCYACQWTGDSIRVYMTIKGCTFPEAVRALNV